jgi:hypothetical protein
VVRLTGQVPQCWKKLRPRYRQVVFCIVAEVIMFLALFAQFYNFRQSLHHLFREQVTDSIRPATPSGKGL